MVRSANLMSDLQDLARTLGDELRGHGHDVATDPWELRTSYAQAVAAGHTSVRWEDWYERRLEEIITGWVLGTVFVRYAEDNGIIYPADPSDDAQASWQWRLHDLAAGLMADPNVIIPPLATQLPETAAKRLCAFWQRQDQQQAGHDLTDPTLSTGIFGDLYQSLSAPARAQYALVQTPDFVEQFILDQTLEPAIDDFGLDGFTMLDPMCGSGTFLLDAFRRLLTHWHTDAPGLSPIERTRRALESIHGVDLNPVAVLITRFRLLIAARAACDGSVSDGYAAHWPLHVAAGDALLGTGGDLTRGPELVRPGRYHVVVGNPPYTIVTDSALDRHYRARYDTCVGKYSLSVPFIQRCFELARPGDEQRSAGYVGLLTANSFAKREFGRKLITDFFATRVMLTQIIDTSGAYIPGHGTPTLILVGRNRPGHDADPIFMVTGLHGEPGAPEDPAHGRVWQSILRHAGRPNRADRWTESALVPRVELQQFPWSLSGRSSTDLQQRIGGPYRLGEVAKHITYLANTGADDIFTAPPGVWRRFGTESGHLVEVVTGSEVRDWTATPSRWGFFPYHVRDDDIRRLPGHHRRLWPYRTVLGNRPYPIGRTFATSNRAWYDWHSISGDPKWPSRRIVFAWVATHTHFAMLSHALGLPSAPAIELPAEVADRHLADLLAVLNSSTVCFWLKQVSSSKGVSSIHHTPGTGGEPWEAVYEFTPARLRDLPLPGEWSTRHGAELANLAVELANTTPAAIAAAGAPTAKRLANARDDWDRIRQRMIALAEEQDWEIYHHYGLLADPTLAYAPDAVPPLRQGERAFEIALARNIDAGTEHQTKWFTRHGATPITDLPTSWPNDYRDLVEARITAIATDSYLHRLERPEFKRRWTTPSWDAMQAQALREWLLDQCETALAQPGPDESHTIPRPRTIAWLADQLHRDNSGVEVGGLFAPGIDLAATLRGILADEHVPCLAALRYKESGLVKRAGWEAMWRHQRLQDATGNSVPRNDGAADIPIPAKYTAADFHKPSYWRLRGKYDIPSERFTSYPQPGMHDGELLLGWAGWTSTEHKRVLVDLIEAGFARDEPDTDALVALLAALHELQQWGTPSIDPTPLPHAISLRHWLDRLTLTVDDLERWRPKPPRRGRPSTRRLR